MNTIDLSVTVVRQGHAGSTQRRVLDSRGTDSVVSGARSSAT